MRDWRREIASRVRSAGHDLDDDLLEELAQHASALYERERADGASHDEAAAAVMGQIGTWTSEAAALTRRGRRPPRRPRAPGVRS